MHDHAQIVMECVAILWICIEFSIQLDWWTVDLSLDSVASTRLWDSIRRVATNPRVDTEATITWRTLFGRFHQWTCGRRNKVLVAVVSRRLVHETTASIVFKDLWSYFVHVCLNECFEISDLWRRIENSLGFVKIFHVIGHKYFSFARSFASIFVVVCHHL